MTLTLFPKFRLSLLDCGNKHISTCSGRKSIETTTDSSNSNNEQVFGTYRRSTHYGINRINIGADKRKVREVKDYQNIDER